VLFHHDEADNSWEALRYLLGSGRGRLPAAAPASLVMSSAAAHRNGSLQSRRNMTVTAILEDQSDGDDGA